MFHLMRQRSINDEIVSTILILSNGKRLCRGLFRGSLGDCHFFQDSSHDKVCFKWLSPLRLYNCQSNYLESGKVIVF